MLLNYLSRLYSYTNALVHYIQSTITLLGLLHSPNTWNFKLNRLAETISWKPELSSWCLLAKPVKKSVLLWHTYPLLSTLLFSSSQRIHKCLYKHPLITTPQPSDSISQKNPSPCLSCDNPKPRHPKLKTPNASFHGFSVSLLANVIATPASHLAHDLSLTFLWDKWLSPKERASLRVLSLQKEIMFQPVKLQATTHLKAQSCFRKLKLLQPRC